MKTQFAFRTAQPVTTLASALSLLLLSGSVFARSTIRESGNHPLYQLELEPHVLVGPYDPPGNATGEGLGVGLRATIPVVKDGFIPKLNNSVGVSFGFDYLRYWGDDLTVGSCSRWSTGPGSTRICTEVGGNVGGKSNYLMFPVAMQWNFWLADKFSVFGEPGMTVYFAKPELGDTNVGATPLLQVGGRWHFSPGSALTLRIGYPTVSFGFSALLF